MDCGFGIVYKFYITAVAEFSVVGFDVFEGDLENDIITIGRIIASEIDFAQESVCDILYHGFVIGFCGMPFDFIEFGLVLVYQLVDEGTNFEHAFGCFVLIVVDVVVDIDGWFLHQLVIVVTLAFGFGATGRGIGVGEYAGRCEDN